MFLLQNDYSFTWFYVLIVDCFLWFVVPKFVDVSQKDLFK